jgi:glycosyltransferase involved in cell wall biosynthesis
MRWLVVTPFLLTKDQDWIHRRVVSPRHSFDVIAADYAHERSRKSSSLAQWRDFARQSLRAWTVAWRSGGRPTGFITAFPQIAVCVGLLKRLTGSKRPVVAWFFNLGRKYGGRKGRLAAFALAGVEAFVVHSRREIKTYASMLGLPEDRFVFVPFTEELVEPTEGEDSETPFILSMGTANRDYRALLDAVRQSGLRTVIVAGPHALDGLAVPANVTVLSGLSLEACHRLCQQARVNVIPLDTEDTASGQVTLRYAMMFGKAVVATVSIGTEDYIEDGVTGLLVPPHDPTALASAIHLLWEDPARREAIGRAARAWLLDHAGFEVGPTRLGEILDRLEPRAGPTAR